MTIHHDTTQGNRGIGPAERHTELLQTIFDHIPIMINLFDRAGRITLINREWQRVLGWSLEEAQNIDVLAECYPDPLVRQEVGAFIGQPPQARWQDYKTRVRDGRVIDTSWTTMRLTDGSTIGIGKDITARKRTEEMLAEYYERVQALSRQILSAQERERRHLARELHDEFGQVLATIRLHLHAAQGLAGDAAAPHLKECGALLQQAGEQVRNLALDLRPVMLDVAGLEPTLEWLVERHRLRTGCAVQFTGHLDRSALPPDLAIACFRVVQEALTNVGRHAGAQKVWIELGQTERALEVAIRDDGVGFDVLPTQRRAVKSGSFGLLGMAERVHLLGGSLEVDSAPGRGTRICATFPLAAPQAHCDR